MRKATILIVGSLATTLSTCAPAGHRDSLEERAQNMLTAEERAAGWRQLFDGTTTAGWRGYRKDTVPQGWQVVDGALTRVGPGETS